MALKIETSVLAGLATGTLVYGIYQSALPTQADIRSLEAQNSDIERSEKVASWTSAAVVAGVSLIARDPTIFVIGGTIMVGMSWMNRHANAVTPTLSSVTPLRSPNTSQADAPGEYATPKAPVYDSVI
jgi:hypothetical protein